MRCKLTDRQPDAECPLSTQDRLLSAALDVLYERGYRGATSREIARVAQVNEVTLFRLFSTKDDLLAAALVRRFETERQLVPTPTGDLEADLVGLCQLMLGHLDTEGRQFFRLLPEIARLPERQKTLVSETLDQTHAALGRLFLYYQGTGELVAREGENLWSVFGGPLLTAALHAELHGLPPPLDPQRHVQLFLDGCRGKRC